MSNWFLRASTYNLQKYLECRRSDDSFADCNKYAQVAWELQIMYRIFSELKIPGIELGLWVDPPNEGWVGPIPHVDPYAKYLNHALILLLEPQISAKSTRQSEPDLWWQKDANGLPNNKTRLEATRKIHGELASAMKKLEGQIKQLEMLVK
jgi:hypothetical protein